MKKQILAATAIAGLLALGACNRGTAAQQAEGNRLENAADNMEAMADNATTVNSAETMENKADILENAADQAGAGNMAAAKKAEKAAGNAM
jgi:hypothetical protein